MNTASKFEFDTVFDAQGNVLYSAQASKRLVPEEIEAIKVEARSEGHAAAMAGVDQERRILIDDIHTRLTDMEEANAQWAREQRALFADLAMAMARKLAECALAQWPREEIQDVLRKAWDEVTAEGAIALVVHPDQVEPLRADLAAAAKGARDFSGAVLGDQALGPADCRIEWNGGGVERSFDAISDKLGRLLHEQFEQSNPAGETDETQLIDARSDHV